MNSNVLVLRIRIAGRAYYLEPWRVGAPVVGATYRVDMHNPVGLVVEFDGGTVEQSRSTVWVGAQSEDR